MALPHIYPSQLGRGQYDHLHEKGACLALFRWQPITEGVAD